MQRFSTPREGFLPHTKSQFILIAHLFPVAIEQVIWNHEILAR